jgi:hypothetical protein
MPQALTTEAPQPTRREPLYVKLPARGQRTVLDHDAVASNQRSLVGEASVGAIWGIVHHRVTRGSTQLLPGLADYATYIVLAPVIGGEAAAKVILAGEEEPESLG